MSERICDLSPVVADFMQSVPERDRFMGPDILQQHLEGLAGNKSEYATADFVPIRDEYGREHHPFVVESRDPNTSGAAYLKRTVHTDELVCADAAAHATEQAMTTDLLSRLGLRKLITYSADQEGARLGQRLSEYPLTLENFLRYSYRSATQPDWAYPFDYGDSRFRPDPERHVGTIGSMQIIEDFQPTVIIPGHSAALLRGVYWYLSKGNEPLVDALVHLAAATDTPITEVSDVTYVGRYQPGINYPITARLMADNNDYVPYLGDSSGGYMERVAPESVYVFSEMPLFLNGIESTPDQAKVAETMGRMQRIVQLGKSVLNVSQGVDGQALPYVQSLELLTNLWQQDLNGSELEKTIRMKGPSAEVFRCARMLSSALRITELAGAVDLRDDVQRVVHDSAEQVSRTLLRVHTVRDMVRMQAGTLALAALHQSDRL